MSDLDTIIINLKACLVSTKGGIPLNQIENDYFKLNGERIQFRKLGFSSLEELLNSSRKFIITRSGGINVVQALTDNKTQHLTDLIKRQKSKPPKKFQQSRIAPPRRFNTSSNFNRPNNFPKSVNNSSIYRPVENYNQNASVHNHTNSQRRPSYNIRSNQLNINQPRTNDHNIYKKDKHTFNTNGESYSTREKKLPHTSSCSSLESTYSSSSASYTPKNSSINSDKIQIENYMMSKTANQMVHQPIDNNIPLQEKSGNLKSPNQSSTKFPSVTVMPIKPSTAQSRLQKYPKKFDELLNKVDNKEKKRETEQSPVQLSNLSIEDSEVIDDYDYIEELESYLRNLNLSEPYYECMVKKEKNGRAIKLIHICTIKINERSVSSSFPVECSTIEYAKKIAAKHALTVLKKQYGESVVYPFTSDINIMAFRIKEFLKSGYEETGIMSDLLERLYREKFKENLPDGWVQLLEVYSYFTFDKLVANKIMIYLNEIENSNGISNGHSKSHVDETNFNPGSPLMLEDYDEKSVLVSANYGSTSVWIRFVGQNADENFIQMQAKFNETMNSSNISLLEDVTEGAFCAVLYNSSWHRVQICSLPNDNGNVTCFMVDTGEQLDISKDQLCNLEPMFLKPNTQAIQCILTLFDNFGTFYGLKELLDEMILNKTFFLIPDRLDEDGARVTLYEKGGLSDSDRVNVNEKIMHSFLQRTLARLPSFEENEVVDGIVSAVVESGHLFLQLKYDVVVSLEEILPNDEFLTPEFFLSGKEEVDTNQVYLMKYENENVWSRIKIQEIINNSEAKVIYIDYGNISICEITKIAKLYEFDPLMTMIPPQAIKVSMNLLPPNKLTTDIASKILDIISDNKVLVNLINAPLNDVPCVQLYKTEPDSDLPLCVNIQLAQSLKKQTTTT